MVIRWQSGDCILSKGLSKGRVEGHGAAGPATSQTPYGFPRGGPYDRPVGELFGRPGELFQAQENTLSPRRDPPGEIRLKVAVNQPHTIADDPLGAGFRPPHRKRAIICGFGKGLAQTLAVGPFDHCLPGAFPPAPHVPFPTLLRSASARQLRS